MLVYGQHLAQAICVTTSCKKYSCSRKTLLIPFHRASVEVFSPISYGGLKECHLFLGCQAQTCGHVANLSLSSLTNTVVSSRVRRSCAMGFEILPPKRQTQNSMGPNTHRTHVFRILSCAVLAVARGSRTLVSCATKSMRA
jgi:hypothetical protein